MKLKRITAIIVLVAVVTALTAGVAYTQNSRSFVVTLTNICSAGTLSVSQVIMEIAGTSTTANTPFLLPPGGAANVTFNFNSTAAIPDPTSVTVLGALADITFRAIFEPIVLGQSQATDPNTAGGCLQMVVVDSTSDNGGDDGGTPTPQPIDPDTSKPVVEGQTLNDVLATLGGSGFPVSIDGSEANPKLGNVGDPILLRAIDGFSAQVVWVSAPGTLRSVITWDNPNVDLDLLVFGLGACFQLNGTGILAELCDRPFSGPVVGNSFAVVIINWTATPQSYTLSLSP